MTDHRKSLLVVALALTLGAAGLHFSCTPSQVAWAQTVLDIAKVTVVAAQAATQLLAPADAQEVQKVAGVFQAVEDAAQAYLKNQSAGNLAAISAAITQADQEIAAFEVFVKNPGEAALITELAGVFADALAQIAADYPSATHVSAKLVLKSHGNARGWGAEQFKSAYGRLDPRLVK
jgi:hypothetical protein